ncbi:MAG: type II toxin-antitoxin system PemK/MazF family toxin [Propioniciclava sp.]|uniref:type II toxin-antitoxin system PemK/MazF family toxin n=1 Tax=Propioniciclava sp. TaxID=2038686 RepID=UPI0039E67065
MKTPSLTGLVRSVLRTLLSPTPAPVNRRAPGPARPQRTEPRRSATYPGDYQGMPRTSYGPRRDAAADPGEIVWTWVPYEEDHAQGKDRPVLIVGVDGRWLLGLQLTSVDHDRDAAQEARAGRYWVDIGTGDWDQKRRPSEVRVNRVIRVDPDAVRRVSVHIPQAAFDRVVAGMRTHLTGGK